MRAQRRARTSRRRNWSRPCERGSKAPKRGLIGDIQRDTATEERFASDNDVVASIFSLATECDNYQIDLFFSKFSSILLFQNFRSQMKSVSYILLFFRGIVIEEGSISELGLGFSATVKHVFQ